MSEDVVVELNLDDLTIGDVVLIEDWGRGITPTRALVEFLQTRVTNDVELASLLWTELAQILTQVRRRLFSGQGNS